MVRIIVAASVLALPIFGFVTPSGAADMDAVPVKAARAVTQQSGSWYLRLDGSYQSYRLPTYDLGFVKLGPGLTSVGQFDSFDPRVDGAGVSGAIGYVLPVGTLPGFFGTDTRFELGVSYVHARASQTSTGSFVGNDAGIQTLDGTTGFNITGCGVSCTTAATLESRYTAWSVAAKIAGDRHDGNITVTPSFAVFGGNTRNDQTLVQSLGVLANYDVNSALRWTDIGIKPGVNVAIDMAHGFTFNLGGSVGVAGRFVSLAASDSGNFSLAPLASSISANSTTLALLTNAEAGVTARLTPAAAFRIFTGFNYDSRVPGIALPGFTGAFTTPTSTTPAGLKFKGETSFYAGGGVTIKFGP